MVGGVQCLFIYPLCCVLEVFPVNIAPDRYLSR